MKNGNKNQFDIGDVFAVPLPTGEYIFGKILLCIQRLRTRCVLSTKSPLLSLGSPVLVEMYESTSREPQYTPSNVLIPGVFLQTDTLGGVWPIVENTTVDFKSIEFPESLIGHRHRVGEAAFQRGEIRILLPITDKELCSIDVFATAHSTYFWPAICLRHLGRNKDIPDELQIAEQLSNHDLRFSPHREKVYAHLPLDPNDSYYEQQKQLGLNIERLYE